MNYHWYIRNQILILALEARFSLLDFILLFTFLLLGLTTFGFFLAFAIGYIAKIFSRREFEFDMSGRKFRQYVVIFGGVRIKLRSYSFSEIESIIYTNYDLGNPYWPVNWMNSRTYTILAETKNNRIMLVKIDETDRDVTDQLYEDMSEKLSDYFTLNSEFLESRKDRHIQQ